MPVGVFKTVREVSSEDPVHPAVNLLKLEPGKTWKTKSTGEKEGYVIFEFEEPQTITGIDIGNEHSAFVGVLVSKSGSSKDDFQEILMMSSLMTPTESKNSTNYNRIRCFNKAALVETLVEEKYRMVKVVCIQPFNKHVQYGLAFIKVHVKQAEPKVKEKCLVPENFLNKIAPNVKPLAIGNIMLRKESTDSDSESAGSLFARWKMSRNNNNKTTLSPTLQLRNKTSTSTGLNMTSSQAMKCNDVKGLDRNRADLLFGDEDDDEIGNEKQSRLSKHIQQDKEKLRLETEKLKTTKEREKEKLKVQKEKDKEKRQSINNANNTSTTETNAKCSSEKQRALKRLSSPIKINSIEPPKKKKLDESLLQYRPFNQLLSGVVLVISGIQNPERSDLRNKALALGAKYKTDWDGSCTHLICAFKNTPKYNQVRGKGKIVTASWIQKCYGLKKYLPWRRYALDSMDLSQPESDEELLDETLKPTRTEESDSNDNMLSDDNKDQNREIDEGVNNTLALYGLEENNVGKQHESSGSDTEDELERVAQKNKLINNNVAKKCRTSDVFEVDTDEEDYLAEKRNEIEKFKNNPSPKHISVL